MEGNYDQIKIDKSKESEIPKEKQPQTPQDERNCGFWNQEEQLNYVFFIDFFKEDLQSKHKRKFNKIFKTMSQFLKTRDAIQCRSHHMKQLRTLRKIRNIIRQTKNTMEQSKYKEEYEKVISNSSIFKVISPRSTRYKASKKIQPKTKQIGVQTISVSPAPPLGEVEPDISVPNFFNFPQNNFVVFPVWNYSQNGAPYNLNF